MARIRRVYNDHYEIGEFNRIFFYHDIQLIFEFFVGAAKFCVDVTKKGALPRPSQVEITKLDIWLKRRGRRINLNMLNQCIDIFNHQQCTDVLVRARDAQLQPADRRYLSAARYPLNESRLGRFKEEYAAYRINSLLRAIESDDNPKNGRAYDIGTFEAFHRIVKDYYLPSRSREMRPRRIAHVQC